MTNEEKQKAYLSISNLIFKVVFAPETVLTIPLTESEREIVFQIQGYLTNLLNTSGKTFNVKHSYWDTDSELNLEEDVKNCANQIPDVCNDKEIKTDCTCSARENLKNYLKDVNDIFSDIVSNIPKDELTWIDKYLSEIKKRDDDDEVMDLVKDAVIESLINKLINGEEVELTPEMQAEVIDVLGKELTNYKFVSINNKCKLFK